MANRIERKIYILKNREPRVIEYVQGASAVPIILTLMDYDIPEDATARVYVLKPSGKGEYDTATIEDNGILIDVKSTMFDETGTSRIQASVKLGDKTLITFSQEVDVSPNKVPGEVPESENKSNFLDEYMEKMEKLENDNYETLEAKKANAANPVFAGSMSMGRTDGSAVGESSAALGVNNVASGKAAYAEGSQTQATGKYGHAEGWGTEAAGESSHAEGNSTKATGMEAHAEGALTQASGNRAHAEGHHTSALGEHSHAEGLFTSAKATNSHAEGVYTTATGDHSHAEGLSAKATGHTAHAEGNNTEAAGTNQHVQGKYNVVDTEGKYAHIVGNGTDDKHRSNAHTVDWKGNAWFAGKVSQEGTPTEDKDLATKKYVDDNFLTKDFAVVNSWADVQKVVRMGMGHLIFPVGYEFTTLDSNTGNDIVWVVRGHNYHKAADESLKYTMTLETRHVYSQKSGTFLPLQFSALQAAYYAADGLSAGTYHFTGSKLPWHSSAEGKKYQFTINNAIPAGGQIVINMTPPSSYTSCKIDTFSSAASSDPIESDITIAEGEEGTHIGIIYSGSGNMNIDGRVLYGSNNYAQSVVRQWLNSSSAAGSVWIPATNFDRPPKWNVSAPSGFAGGLPEDFLEVAQPAVVPCYTNAKFEVNGRDDTTFKLNTAYTLRDKFFLLSVPEIYPVSGLKQLEYYEGVTTNADRIKYDINGTKTPIWLRLNLSGMSDPYDVNVMTTNGNYSTAAAADWANKGVCPACIIA